MEPCSSPGSQVVTVDVRNKKAVFKDGFKLEYSKLLLAPGSRWEGPAAPRQAEGWGRGQELTPLPNSGPSQPQDPELQRQRRGNRAHHPDARGRQPRGEAGPGPQRRGRGGRLPWSEQPGSLGVALAAVQGASPSPPAPGMEVAAYLTEGPLSVVVEVRGGHAEGGEVPGGACRRALMKVSPLGIQPHRAPACPVPPVQLTPAAHPPPDRCLRTTVSSSTYRLRCQSCGPRRARWAPPPLPASRPFCPLSCAPELLTRPAALRS